MNETSASPAEPPAPAAPARERRLVWDAPVRVFHWLMVLCFAGAWLTSESERWSLVHVSLGYTLGALVVFRLVWGLVGTRHARFASFVRSPLAAWRYLRSLHGPQPEHHVGHNPAGALAVLALLTLATLLVGSGWAIYHEVGPHVLERLHETAAELMLALVAVHVVAVVLSSRLHGENLVRSMVDGRKLAPAGEGIQREWRALAALMLVAALGFWALQWGSAAQPGGEHEARLATPSGDGAALAERTRHGRGETRHDGRGDHDD